MYKNFITKTDLINMYNDDLSNLKNAIAGLQDPHIKYGARVALMVNYRQECFNPFIFYLDGDVNERFAFITIFESKCEHIDPTKFFYDNLDVIVDGFNNNFKEYWDWQGSGYMWYNHYVESKENN